MMNSSCHFTVAMGTPDDCREHNQVTLKSQSGYLSSLMTEETGYGLAGCPWRIKARPGQNLEVSVLDFNLLAHFESGNDPYSDEFSGWCPVSLVIEDQDNMKDVILCNGGQRQRHLYSSTSNQLLLHFVLHQVHEPHYYYLVQFKGIY